MAVWINVNPGVGGLPSVVGFTQCPNLGHREADSLGRSYHRTRTVCTSTASSIWKRNGPIVLRTRIFDESGQPGIRYPPHPTSQGGSRHQTSRWALLSDRRGRHRPFPLQVSGHQSCLDVPLHTSPSARLFRAKRPVAITRSQTPLMGVHRPPRTNLMPVTEVTGCVSPAFVMVTPLPR